MSNKAQQFIFVGDPIQSNEFASIKISDDFLFRKATEDESKHIRKTISTLSNSGIAEFSVLIWERRLQPTQDGNSEWKELPYEQFRYWVIEHDCSDDLSPEDLSSLEMSLRRACKLSSINLRFAFHLGPYLTYSDGSQAPGIGQYQDTVTCLNFLIKQHRLLYRDIKTITQENIIEIQRIYSSLKSFDFGKYEFIERAFNLFDGLDLVLENPALRSIGFFQSLSVY